MMKMNNQEKEENIWDAFERILLEFPEDIFEDLPNDLAENHDKDITKCIIQ